MRRCCLGIASLVLWHVTMLLYYFLALVAIWLGLICCAGSAFSAYVRRELAHVPLDYAPFVSVIAPFRGVEEGLRENLTKLFEQCYPAYEIIFVTDSTNDPGLKVVAELSDKLQFVDDDEGHSTRAQTQSLATVDHDNLKIVGQVDSKIVIAGAASDSGQKVHNLRRAVTAIDPRAQVLVFVDSDARPHANWLRSLVAPLSDNGLGATTGYRWFTAMSLCGQLRSVWNA